MNGKTENRIKELNEINTNFQNNFSGLSTEDLNYKPTPEIWSIAEIIHHLILTNESYFPVFDQVKSGKYKVVFTGKFSFLAEIFGNMIYKSVLPETQRKTKTFDIWNPVRSNINGNILKRFSETQEKLINLIKNSEDIIRRNPVISSPVNKYIVYRLDKAFDIIIAHEKRHYNQANQVKERLKE